MSQKSFVTIFVLVFSYVVIVLSTPPEDPIKCSSSNNTTCTITNSYGMFPDRTTCQASQALYPTNEQELISMVATASRAKTKIKVATRYSHSITKLVCPEDSNGILISTRYLNKVVKIDVDEKTITVESGVTLKDLIDEASRKGLVLPYTPYWYGLTIGGLMGTGAHGSTLWNKGSAVHDYVVEIRIVRASDSEDGYAKVEILNGNNDEDFNAAKVSLGVLGVISQVWFILFIYFYYYFLYSFGVLLKLAIDVFWFFGYIIDAFCLYMLFCLSNFICMNVNTHMLDEL